MEPILCLKSLPPWLTDHGIVALFRAIEAAGGEARFVGGCVRDTLLGRDDGEVEIDVATTLRPQVVMTALEAAGIEARTTGIAHGTVTALAASACPDVASGRRPVEITTLREDVETDGRHAVVRFSADWLEDARRRDFTMNALTADLAGRVWDPLGGIDDLMAGRVRFIGDPLQRIAEDALRILRFFRFQARYGHGDVDPDGLEACRQSRDKLAFLSGERIRAELVGLLGATDPAGVWKIMDDTGILESLFRYPGDPDLLASAVAMGPYGTDAVFRLGLGAARAVRVKPDDLARRLRLSRAEQRCLQAVSKGLALAERRGDAVDEATVTKVAVENGPVVARTFVAARKAAHDPFLTGAENLLRMGAVASTPPAFPLRGQDAVAAGLLPGPAVGDVLREVKELWLAHGCQPDRQACLEELSKAVRRAKGCQED